MCDNTGKGGEAPAAAPVATPPESDNLFLVFKHTTVEKLHLQGSFATLDEASSFVDANPSWGETAIACVPTKPLGSTRHVDGRHIASMNLADGATRGKTQVICLGE